MRENKQQQLETYFAQQQSDLAVIGKTVESFQIAAESKLAAIRDAKQVALQEYLQTIKAQSIDLAKNKLIVESMWALPNFFGNYIPEQNLEEVDLIINTGPWGDNDKLENYVDILDCANKYSIPMICSKFFPRKKRKAFTISSFRSIQSEPGRFSCTTLRHLPR